MSDRKKPGIAFWATVVLAVVLVFYPLSFGPACWVTSRMAYPHLKFETVYLPLAWSAVKLGEPALLLLNRYAQLGMPSNRVFLIKQQPVAIFIWANLPARRTTYLKAK